MDRVVPRNDYGLLMVLGGALARVHRLPFPELVDPCAFAPARPHAGGRPDDAWIHRTPRRAAVWLFSTALGRRSDDAAEQQCQRARNHHCWRAFGLLDGGFVALYLLILFAISVSIAIVAVALGALQVAIVLLTWRRQREFMSANLQTQAAAQAYQFEMLTGMETLKVMGVEQAAVDRWSDLFVDVLNVSIARGQLGAMIEATTGALRLGSPLLILGIGGLKVLNGDLTLGTMLAVTAVAGRFPQPPGHARDDSQPVSAAGKLHRTTR